MQALFSKNMRFLTHLRIPTVRTFFHRCQSVQCEESRNDEANCFFGEKKSRIVLDSARVAHKYRGQFYAVAARFERQRKKKRQIAVSSDLRGAIVGDIHTGNLFGGL